MAMGVLDFQNMNKMDFNKSGVNSERNLMIRNLQAKLNMATSPEEEATIQSEIDNLVSGGGQAGPTPPELGNRNEMINARPELGMGGRNPASTMGALDQFLEGGMTTPPQPEDPMNRPSQSFSSGKGSLYKMGTSPKGSDYAKIMLQKIREAETQKLAKNFKRNAIGQPIY